MTLSLLIVASETPEQQDDRRARSGQASHETFETSLRRLDSVLDISHVNCVTEPLPEAAALTRHDGLLFAGSPIQMHEDSPETRAAAAFMARVFEAGGPSYGSCAGLQIATVGAGGTVRARPEGKEAGVARGIVALVPDHPFLAGRPLTWDALAMHGSEVDRRPDGMTVLARTRDTPVQAAEIRSGAGVHWGVQYHPEVSPAEIAEAMREAADDLVAQGCADAPEGIAAQAARLAALGADGTRTDIAWQIGVQPEIASEPWRMTEITNFLTHLRARR